MKGSQRSEGKIMGKLISCYEAAKLVKRHPSTLYRLVSTNKIKGYGEKGSWRVDTTELLKMFAEDAREITAAVSELSHTLDDRDKCDSPAPTPSTANVGATQQAIQQLEKLFIALEGLTQQVQEMNKTLNEDRARQPEQTPPQTSWGRRLLQALRNRCGALKPIT